MADAPTDQSGTGTDDWRTLAVLAEPTRRAVFDVLRHADQPLTRDEVSARSGLNRRLATFHLDRLADAGLAVVDYLRPPGRRGPGAGRPPKRYRCAAGEWQVSMPSRRYELASRILARGAAASAEAEAAVLAAAGEEGVEVGSARAPAGRMSAARALAEVAATLADLGFEPDSSGAGRLRLRNCPFAAAVGVAPALVCQANQRLVTGIVEGMGLGDAVTAALGGEPGDCCVTVASRRGRGSR